MIPIAKPIMGDDEIQAVTEVLRSGMLAQGKVVTKFEGALSEYIGIKNAIAVSNGTAALDITLKSLDIRNGDEVIVPAFTFISTANAVLFQSAKPIFADVDMRTFNIDPNDVMERITDKTKAIIGVHLFGHPFEVKELQEICEDHSLYLIEDCAQSIGAGYEGMQTGNFGTLGCFSFYATKNMTTGEGGLIATSSDELSTRCRLLRNHGESQKYYHTVLGSNCRMTDIQAAIGVVQLKKLDQLNERRIRNAAYLNKRLKISGLRTPYTKKNVKHVYHQYAAVIEENFPLTRDEFMKYLEREGIGSAIHYPLPIHKQPLYQRLGYTDEAVRCPNAVELSGKILSLPTHPALGEGDLAHIVNAINNIENGYRT